MVGNGKEVHRADSCLVRRDMETTRETVTIRPTDTVVNSETSMPLEGKKGVYRWLRKPLLIVHKRRFQIDSEIRPILATDLDTLEEVTIEMDVE